MRCFFVSSTGFSHNDHSQVYLYLWFNLSRNLMNVYIDCSLSISLRVYFHARKYLINSCSEIEHAVNNDGITKIMEFLCLSILSCKCARVVLQNIMYLMCWKRQIYFTMMILLGNKSKDFGISTIRFWRCSNCFHGSVKNEWLQQLERYRFFRVELYYIGM